MLCDLKHTPCPPPAAQSPWGGSRLDRNFQSRAPPARFPTFPPKFRFQRFHIGFRRFRALQASTGARFYVGMVTVYVIWPQTTSMYLPRSPSDLKVQCVPSLGEGVEHTYHIKLKLLACRVARGDIHSAWDRSDSTKWPVSRVIAR